MPEDWMNRIKRLSLVVQSKCKNLKYQNMAKVLILEQSKSMRNTLRERLEFEGFATAVAERDDINEGIEPVYVELPGWNQDLTKMKSEEEFPQAFKDYIAFLEKELETPIVLVSVGPDRDQTIERK